MTGRSILRQVGITVGILAVGTSALALEQLGAVSQVIQNKKVVEFSITSATAQVQAGTQITVQFKDNVNCETSVEAVADKLARASLADCERFSSVVVGQAIHLSAFQTQVAAPAAPAVTTATATATASAAAASGGGAATTAAGATAESSAAVAQAEAVVQPPVVQESAPSPQEFPVYVPKRGRFSLGLLASGANQIVFEEAEVTSGTVSGTAKIEIETETAGGLFAEYFYSAPNSSGFSLGLSFDASRELKSLKATANGNSATFNGLDNSVVYTTLYANYVYQWTKGYFFMGPNYMSPKFASGEISKYANGSIGLQIGGGLMLNDKMALDFGIRSVGMFVDPYNDGTDSIAMNYGSSTGAQLNLKFFLN